MAATPSRYYDVTPDGQKFLTVMATGPEPDRPVTHLYIVLNWFDELKARVPTRR